MNKKNIINYSVLAIPLAFVGLPIYINVSDFYIRQFDVNMAFLAFIILAVRLLDAIQEPLNPVAGQYPASFAGGKETAYFSTHHRQLNWDPYVLSQLGG